MSVTSTGGNIDNTNRGNIYSYASGTGSTSGAVFVTATNGTLDTTNGGVIYSYSDSGASSDVYLTAPTLLYTRYDNTDSLNPTYVESQGYDSNNNLTNGTIHIQANTINRAATSTLSASDFEQTQGSEGNYIWFGNLSFTDLKSLTYTLPAAVSEAYNANGYTLSSLYANPNMFGTSLSSLTLGTDYQFTVNGSAATTIIAPGTYTIGVTMLNSNYALANSGSLESSLTIAAAPVVTPSVTVAPQINKISATISSQLANTVQSNNNMQTVQTTVNPEHSSFASGSSFAQSTSSISSVSGDSNKANSSDNMTTSAAPMEGQVRFAVGHDITGSGNATAFSTSIPGVFVLSGNE